MLSLLLCITSCIECAASCPVPYKQSLFYKLLDCVLDGSFAECRAKLHDFTLGELADLIVDSPTYRFDRRQLLINQHHALLKFTVRSQNGLQQILDKRRGIFCIFRPAFLILLKHILKASCILQYFVQYLHRHHCHGICRIKNSENRRIRIKLLIEYAKKLI